MCDKMTHSSEDSAQHRQLQDFAHRALCRAESKKCNALRLGSVVLPDNVLWYCHRTEALVEYLINLITPHLGYICGLKMNVSLKNRL